jgi:4-amino-4-deoxy-L-arabinose transferase-like glycosyltransferase
VIQSSNLSNWPCTIPLGRVNVTPNRLVVTPTGSVNLQEGQKPATTRANSSEALPSSRRPPCPLVAISLVAFLVRLVSLGIIRHWPITPDPEFWKLGFEIVNIATSVVTHHGFSSPFGIASGPTAWIPPVYPYLLAGIFTITGLRSNLAAVTIFTMQSLFSALTCLAIYGIGKKAFDEKTARWASWAWALFPYTVLIPVLFIWETTLSALLLAVLCYLCMDLPTGDLKRQVTVGALWGVAALTNPALLSVMPFFVLCPYLHTPAKRVSLRALIVLAMVCAVMVGPWTFRNWRVLGKIVPIRSNFGEELWQGNHEGGTGRIMAATGPAQNRWERERYRQLGEIAYLAQRRRESMNFISQHPGQYFRWMFFRFRYWWFAEGESAAVYFFYRLLGVLTFIGAVLAWLTARRTAYLPIIAIVVYPIIYYVTDVYARYRHPIEPFMVLLATVAAVRLASFFKAGVLKF